VRHGVPDRPLPAGRGVSRRNPDALPPVPLRSQPKENTMRGILAWLIGIPIPIIIILYFLDVF